MEILRIPIFPLRTVLYPGGRLALRIFEQRYVDMTKVCLRDDGVFGICLIREGEETGRTAVPWGIGCTARIKEWDVPSPGLFSLMTEGESVFRILSQETQADGLIVAEVQMCAPPPQEPLPREHEHLARLLAALIEKVGDKLFAQPLRLDEAHWVGFRLAELLPLPTPLKLELLETPDTGVLLAAIERTLKSMTAGN